jgi:glycosyltransferase involved in cell wall biosynthesis
MRISIIIPTRERARYLGASLATATAINDPDVEIVVSDNASTDDTRQVVESNSDARIRYVNTGARLSMRQNFEFALNQSSGDYVIYFGDDDGILAGQFPMLRRILEERKPDALSWGFPVFGWPVPGYGVKTGGIRFTRKSAFGTPFQLDRTARLRAVESGEMNALYPMPGLYHGCMSQSYLNRLATADGTFFAARIPDVYMNFRALQHGGNFMHVSHPFSINGYSPASTGGSLQTLGKDSKTQSPAQRFMSELSVDPIKDVLPFSKSITMEFLGTLETVRHLFPDEPVTPDYDGWYRHAIAELGRKDAETADDIRASLRAHAAQFGAEAALARAMAQGGEPKLDRLKRNFAKFTDKIGGFRLSAEIDGENTILTAAQMCDTVLGQDLMAILEQTKTRAAAWVGARQRSKQFSRQI